MESAVYRQFYELEQEHWWFAGMRAICRTSMARLPVTTNGSTVCLDLGCGTGLWTQELEAFGRVVGLDLSTEALAFCRARGIPRLLQASAEQVPLADASCQLITALGLIEHMDDDAKFVRELARLSAPGGHVLLLTSAYRMLWSEHDTAVHHKRRYTKRELHTLLTREGLFDIVKCSYVNTTLLPAIVGLRGLRAVLRMKANTSEEGTPDLFRVPAILNALLYGVLRTEGWLLRAVDLPFGVGLLAVVRRTGRAMLSERAVDAVPETVRAVR